MGKLDVPAGQIGLIVDGLAAAIDLAEGECKSCPCLTCIVLRAGAKLGRDAASSRRYGG